MPVTVRSLPRFCAIAALIAIAGCATKPLPPAPVPAPPPVPEPQAANPLDHDLPSYLRLPGMTDDVTPVRVGIILPFGSNSAATRTLAQSMMKAAELAMFDSGNRNILLMTADEGNGGAVVQCLFGQILAQHRSHHYADQRYQGQGDRGAKKYRQRRFGLGR